MGHLRHLKEYRESARTFAQASSCSLVTAYCAVLRSRFGADIGPYYFSLFCIDGRPPSDLGSYLIHDKFNSVQRRWNPETTRTWLDNKYLFYSRCLSANIPVPPLLGVIRLRSDAVTRDARLIESASDLDAMVAGRGDGDLFFKRNLDAHGLGAFVVRARDGRCELEGRQVSADEILASARHRLSDEQMYAGEKVYLIQPRLQASRQLDPVMGKAGLGTIRVVTTCSQGSCRLLAATLRMTVGANVTDNFSAGRSGNIAAPIELDTGRLGLGVWSVHKSWPDMRSVDRHPDTGRQISGFEIPHWRAVVDLALLAHRQFPEAGAVGWDIALTEEGPLILEANSSWDVNLMQITHREGFRPRLTTAMGTF